MKTDVQHSDVDQIVVGLDIGTTKIVALVAERYDTDKLRILGMGKAVSNGVNRGVINNAELTTEAIREALAEAEADSGLLLDRVILGIAGMHVRSVQVTEKLLRHNPEQEITEEDITQLAQQVKDYPMMAGESIIHVLTQDFTLDSDSGISNPVGMFATKFEANFHMVLGKSNYIQNLFKCARRAERDVDEMILEPIASAQSCLYEEEKDMGVVLVDMGGGTTDVAIFKNGIIMHTAVIPLGGKKITEDLSSDCGILISQAESVKTQFGNCFAGEQSKRRFVSIPGVRGREDKEISLWDISKIIRLRMQDICTEVSNEIEAYMEQQAVSHIPGGVVLTGGGALLEGVQTFFNHELALDVKIGLPQEKIKAEDAPRVENPIFSTVVGLALIGLDNLETSTEEKTKEGENQMYFGDSERQVPIFFGAKEFIFGMGKRVKNGISNTFSSWVNGIQEKED